MKKIEKILNYFSIPLVFTFPTLFPFGQLLRTDFILAGRSIPLLGVDLVALISLIYLPFIKFPKISKYIFAFIALSSFSLILSLEFVGIEKAVISFFYFLRIILYTSLFLLTWSTAKKNRKFKVSLLFLIILSLLLTAVFGWVQYTYYFDLRFLKYAGWDDHLGRLTGTFLDPAFTGIILAIAFFIVFLKYFYMKKSIYILLSLIFLVTLLLTYSRASYLTLMIGLTYLFIFKIKNSRKLILLFLGLFLLALPFLPKGEGEGVKLERKSSIVARFKNYDDTIDIIKNNPLFGVGFNNICWLRREDSRQITTSHSCFGSDSSLLLVFATTGITGLILFLNLLKTIFINTTKDYYGNLTKIFLILVIVHSFFSNSMFYPWIMGLGAIFSGLSVKE